jgi:hypothetical protein
LRSFRNKLDHGLLDRFVGAQLLRHLLTGEVPQYSLSRAIQSLSIVADDVEKQFGDRVIVERNFEYRPDGVAPIVLTRRDGRSPIPIDLHSPIAPSAAVFGTHNPAVILLDDLIIRRHLGKAVERIASGL